MADGQLGRRRRRRATTARAKVMYRGRSVYSERQIRQSGGCSAGRPNFGTISVQVLSLHARRLGVRYLVPMQCVQHVRSTYFGSGLGQIHSGTKPVNPGKHASSPPIPSPSPNLLAITGTQQGQVLGVEVPCPSTIRMCAQIT